MEKSKNNDKIDSSKIFALDSLLQTLYSEGFTDALPLECIVKIYVTCVNVDYTSPWKRKEQQKKSGSGFVVKGNLILTNAHLIHRSSSVRVRRPGNAIKFKGSIVCIGQGVDLAAITIYDPRFWKNMSFVRFKVDLPALDTNITCIGYPTGGDGLSITRGVVSRVCSQNLVVRGPKLLMIQIDAAINPGNSGGPVLTNAEHQVIGIATLSYDINVAQNVGYIISVPVIKMFLEQFNRYGKFLGVSMCDFSFQKCENPSMRRELKIPEQEKGGVRIMEVSCLGHSFKHLRANDVLVSLDNNPIAADGTTPLATSRKDERINLECIITSKHCGDNCNAVVYRDGKPIPLSLKLSTKKWLIPRQDGVDCTPKYFIVGGIVFVPLTYPWYWRCYCKRLDFPEDIYTIFHKWRESIDQELVVLAKVLSHDCNFGYQDLNSEILTHLNGEKVKNLAHLSELVSKSESEFLEFRLKSRDVLIVDRIEAKEAEQEIMKMHGIHFSSIGISDKAIHTTTSTTSTTITTNTIVTTITTITTTTKENKK